MSNQNVRLPCFLISHRTLLHQNKDNYVWRQHTHTHTLAHFPLKTTIVANQAVALLNAFRICHSLNAYSSGTHAKRHSLDQAARVQMQNGPAENLWAAGEIMAGSILGQGYLAGFGMTIGTVFGRQAGQEAGAYVKHR